MQFQMIKKSKIRTFIGMAMMAGQIFSVAHAEGIMSIGTGTTNSDYYAIGGGLCRSINLSLPNQLSTICLSKPTKGPTDNLNNILSRSLNVGIVHADELDDAYYGKGIFNQPYTELRSIFGLNNEVLTILVRRSAEITKLQDLSDKTVSIGRFNWYTSRSIERVLTALDNSNVSFERTRYLDMKDANDALCDDKIDASMLMLSYPSNELANVLGHCNVKLLSMEEELLNRVTKSYRYYTKVELPKSTGAKGEALAVPLVLVTTASQPEALVYGMTKAVAENLKYLRRTQPLLKDYQLADMVKLSAAAPLHPGAEKYFKEIGLLK